MPLNVHPLIVHLPIGLLTLYSFLEIISVKRLRSLPYWFYVKAILVIFGSAGTFAALASGLLIKDQFASKLLDVHYNFAISSIIVFSILALTYLLTWFPVKSLWAPAEKIRLFLMTRPVLFCLSGFGFILLSITGALGGALAYGPEVDPAASFIYHLLVE